MDLIDIARASGLAVILDRRIGREEYQSVCGSLPKRCRYADAVRHTTANRQRVAGARKITAHHA